jgi:2,3-diketo-5-methylthio-1-phosphopentane phosphatase
MKQNEKILIIFDVDKTITNEDSLDVISKYLLTSEQKIQFQQNVTDEMIWVDSLNYFYELSKSNGKNIFSIKKALEKVNLTEGMIDLFSFLRKNKKIFDSIIISGGNKFSVNYLIKYHNLDDVIKEQYANQSEIKEDMLYISKASEHNCDICDPSICKKKELDNFFEKYPKNQYNKIFYICDGYNDLCLVRYLQKNDILFLRKYYDLYNTLYVDGVDFKINCKCCPWKDGKEIIRKIKKII